VAVIRAEVARRRIFTATYLISMKHVTLAALLWAVTTVCFAQETYTRYYKEFNGDEVDEKKAKYSITTTRHEDGTETVTRKDLKRNEVIESHRGKEPIGVWVSHWGKEDVKDYNFTLEYGKRDCGQTANPTTLSNESYAIKNAFFDDPAQNYVAPKIASGEENIMKFLQKNVRYPAHARRNGIQGSVYVHMRITKDAKIEDLVVSEGIEVGMDKESVRVMRKLQLATPPMLKGQPVDACVIFPIKYKLAN
jgi:TonB family protein